MVFVHPRPLLLAFLSVLLSAPQHGSAFATTEYSYTVRIEGHSKTPVVSSANAPGRGHAHCGLSFNPSFIPACKDCDPPSPAGILLRMCCGDSCTGHGASSVGAQLAADGLPAERIGFAPCDLETGLCNDTLPAFNLDPSTDAEDPRAFLYDDGFYYNFYYAADPGKVPGPACEGAQCTVKLARSRQPLNASSWQPVAALPWHRNGCCIRKPKGERTYCVFGEGPGPLPGLGISYTTDLASGAFTQVPWSLAPGPSSPSSPLTNDSMWVLPLGEQSNEIKLEAGAHPVQLSSGDWLHLYAAATPGWVAHGNYTVG